VTQYSKASCVIGGATRINFLGVDKAMALKAGDPAPDFSLPAVSGERQFEFRLSDYHGKQSVVITFHPLDWTPT
jgi:AhpC/TSA family